MSIPNPGIQPSNPPGKRRTGWSTEKSDPSKLNDCYKNALQTTVDLELNSGAVLKA